MAKLKEQLETTQREFSAKEQELNSLRQELTVKQQEAAKLSEDLTSTKQESLKLQNDKKDLDTNLKTQAKENKHLESKVSELEIDYQVI